MPPSAAMAQIGTGSSCAGLFGYKEARPLPSDPELPVRLHL